MTGGVCAVLDYDVEQMANYVSTMAIRLMLPHAHVTPSFQKFMSQVLNSTRLPKATILLGMNYLAKKANSMAANREAVPAEGQVWRMLTVALLLGSKYLDDNTFQNKSWAEVSGISIDELNSMETDWLLASNWRFFVNLDESEDFKAWLASWDEWCGVKKMEYASRPERSWVFPVPLPPLNTDVLSVARSHQLQPLWYSSWCPPITPPDSGYGTPDYGHFASSLSPDRANWATAPRHSYPKSVNAYGAAAYSNPEPIPTRNKLSAAAAAFAPKSIWGVKECRCLGCVDTTHRTQMHHFPFFGQAVMG